MTFSIRSEDPAQPDIVALLEAGEARSAALYPAESNHHLPLEALRADHVHFHVGRIGGRAVATGAVVDNGDWGEIKRMFVNDDARGRGFGRQMLEHLLREAERLGLAVLRLETGIASHEALALYRRFGFREIAPFADYRPDPLSVFMEIDLPRNPAAATARHRGSPGG